MTDKHSKIIYTLTDEAPLLPTCSLLPIIRSFTAAAGIQVVKSDISLAARALAAFPERLSDAQKVPDTIAHLGRLTQHPDTNIIKLPNISASVSQLAAAIAELQAAGYPVPDFSDDPQSDEESEIANRYNKILGSAVNPVLREGNSDRRAPAAVKRYARNNPHSMARWSQASRTHVSHMREGDFYSNEISMTMEQDRVVCMDLVTESGETIVLKDNISLQKDEIVDSMFMSKQALCDFYEEEMEDARQTGVMLSLHVKATMMKVSHPIVFGHAVKVYYKDAFEKHGALFERLGVNVNHGLGSVYEKIAGLPGSLREEIEDDLHAFHANRSDLAMVDSS